MGFPSVEDAIEACAEAAEADDDDDGGGRCATKCRRECRDEAEGRDADVRGAVESERLACLGECGV